MTEFFNSISEIYEVYILRDLSKILTGCIVIISWLFYGSNISSFKKFVKLVSKFSNIPFGIWILFIGVGYLLGTLLQEFFSRSLKGLSPFPLNPEIKDISKPYSYRQFEIKRGFPQASRILERIVLSKHIASSTGIILINILIILLLLINWNMVLDKSNLTYFIFVVLALIGICTSSKVCRSKKRDQEELVDTFFPINDE